MKDERIDVSAWSDGSDFPLGSFRQRLLERERAEGRRRLRNMLIGIALMLTIVAAAAMFTVRYSDEYSSGGRFVIGFVLGVAMSRLMRWTWAQRKGNGQ